MKLDRDVIHSMIEKAGNQCGKNTAMVDVFDRFSQLVIEHLKEQGSCQENTKPASLNGSLMYWSGASETLSEFQTYYGLNFGNMLWTFVGWTFPTPVTEIWFSNNRDDNWAVDTVSFSTVPEPSALSLLAVGLGGLAVMRRRS